VIFTEPPPRNVPLPLQFPFLVSIDGPARHFRISLYGRDQYTIPHYSSRRSFFSRANLIIILLILRKNSPLREIPLLKNDHGNLCPFGPVYPLQAVPWRSPVAAWAPTVTSYQPLQTLDLFSGEVWITIDVRRSLPSLSYLRPPTTFRTLSPF